MIHKMSVGVHQTKEYRFFSVQSEGALYGFPFLSIDRDSYIVGLEVQSGIDRDAAGGRHCIAIGKCCSLAESITFMIDVNHDYASVCQGELSCLSDMPKHSKAPRKGSIILQNDVWIGHGATIMAGVTLHNGCVIAADAVVTKDVPPYAIVGGNPARILRYRFDDKTIAALQKIAWWDWSPQLQHRRREDFLLPVSEFTAKYLPEAKAQLEQWELDPSPRAGRGAKTILLIPDFSDPYPLYQKILRQFFEACPPNTALLIYLSKQNTTPEHMEALDAILRQYEDCDCDVILQSGEDMDEHILFQYADAYITTRSQETVYRTCLADLYQTEIVYGTDEPLFRT